MAQRYNTYRVLEKEKYRDKFTEAQTFLPIYVNQYLNAHLTDCEVSSVSAYALDILDFLKYLKTQNALFGEFVTKDIPLGPLGQIDFNDLQEYINTLSFQKFDKSLHREVTVEAGKSRKMRVKSSLSGFVHYLRVIIPWRRSRLFR